MAQHELNVCRVYTELSVYPADELITLWKLMQIGSRLQQGQMSERTGLTDWNELFFFFDLMQYFFG